MAQTFRSAMSMKFGPESQTIGSAAANATKATFVNKTPGLDVTKSCMAAHRTARVFDRKDPVVVHVAGLTATQINDEESIQNNDAEV